MKTRLLLTHVGDALTLVVLALLVFLMGFGTSFALEESYPDWPMRPGLRVMPLPAIYTGLAVIAILLVSIFVVRLRRAAIILAALAMLMFMLLFSLIANDLIVSRAPMHG